MIWLNMYCIRINLNFGEEIEWELDKRYGILEIIILISERWSRSLYREKKFVIY